MEARILFCAFFAWIIGTQTVVHGTQIDQVSILLQDLDAKVESRIEEATAQLKRLPNKVAYIGQVLKEGKPNDTELTHCVDKNEHNVLMIVKNFEAKIQRFNRLRFTGIDKDDTKCTEKCLRQLSKKLKKKMSTVPEKIDRIIDGARKAIDKLTATMRRCTRKEE